MPLAANDERYLFPFADFPEETRIFQTGMGRGKTGRGETSIREEDEIAGKEGGPLQHVRRWGV